MFPTNASNQLKEEVSPGIPCSAATPRGVAPLYPDGITKLSLIPAIHTLSPDN